MLNIFYLGDPATASGIAAQGTWQIKTGEAGWVLGPAMKRVLFSSYAEEAGHYMP